MKQMKYKTRCPRCGITHYFNTSVYPIHCKCGEVFLVSTPQEKEEEDEE